MPRQTLVLSWTLRAVTAHLARGENVSAPDLFVDSESGTVFSGNRYRIEVGEHDGLDVMAPPSGIESLVALARRGELMHVDVPWIEADCVAEVLIHEDEKNGRADLARVVAAAMWGPRPSLERAVERVGLARWQHAEDEIALRGLTAWARARGASIEVMRSGEIRLLLACDAPPLASIDRPQVAAPDAGTVGEPLRHGQHENAGLDESSTA